MYAWMSAFETGRKLVRNTPLFGSLSNSLTLLNSLVSMTSMALMASDLRWGGDDPYCALRTNSFIDMIFLKYFQIRPSHGVINYPGALLETREKAHAARSAPLG